MTTNLAWLFLLLEDQLDKVGTNRCWDEGANQIRGTVVMTERKKRGK